MYRKRQKFRKGRSKRAFKNGARREHPKNRMRSVSMRGGIRL